MIMGVPPAWGEQHIERKEIMTQYNNTRYTIHDTQDTRYTVQRYTIHTIHDTQDTRYTGYKIHGIQNTRDTQYTG